MKRIELIKNLETLRVMYSAPMDYAISLALPPSGSNDDCSFWQIYQLEDAAAAIDDILVKAIDGLKRELSDGQT